MNIHVYPKHFLPEKKSVYCPVCHSQHHCKHGVYIRKGFHLRSDGTPTLVPVQRYRCRNRKCPRRTFSILPPLVLRYCRFFWPDLLTVKKLLDGGHSSHHIARHVVQMGWSVIKRASNMLQKLECWICALHQEVTDGRTDNSLLHMTRRITQKIGYNELSSRWYRHRYLLRF